MSLNGSGVAVINSAGQPVVASTLITATAMNALTADLATMISTAIMKDGQQTITANIPFNDKKITGLGAGSARTDAASLATIQDGTGVYVGTVGGTSDAITLTPSPAITAYAAGQTFLFIASGANTTAVTVAVSGLASPKAITKNGTTALVAGDIPSGMMVQITYDGTRFILGTTGSATIPAGVLPLTGGTLTGNLLFTDATYDIGASAATRPRDFFLSRNAVIGGTVSITGTASPLGLLDISGASAGQVKFPATQNASSDVNTLDDYEEGTWTPSLGGSATYTSRSGTYTKIGRLVHINLSMQVNAIGTGSTTTVSGLPFTNNGDDHGLSLGFYGTLATAVVSLYGRINGAGNTSLSLFGSTAAATGNTGTSNIFGNSTQVNASGFYII